VAAEYDRPEHESVGDFPRGLRPFLGSPDPEGIPVGAFTQRWDNIPAAIATYGGMMQNNTEVVGTPTFKQADEMSHETGPLIG
jgi:hypothetical protein